VHCATGGLLFTSIAVFLLLFSLSVSGFASNFNIFFWNLDARELALGGSVGARESTDWVLAGNPAALPVSSKGDRVGRMLAFPNAFRMATLLVYEIGALPYDAVTSDERLNESREHSKWLAFSLLSLYRFVYRLPGVTFVFLPMREYPVKGGWTVFNTAVGVNVDIVSLIRIGISGNWYYSCDAPRWKPFALSSPGKEIKAGFGGSVGIYLDFDSVSLSLDYRAEPGSVFKQLQRTGLPERNNSFSLALCWQVSRELSLSVDTPNWNNRSRGDFLLPRAAGEWLYHQIGTGKAALQAAVFHDGTGDMYISCGTSIEGQARSYRYRASVAGIFGLSGNDGSILAGSLDFFM